VVTEGEEEGLGLQVGASPEGEAELEAEVQPLALPLAAGLRELLGDTVGERERDCSEEGEKVPVLEAQRQVVAEAVGV
jgi:hypothetical protein